MFSLSGIVVAVRVCSLGFRELWFKFFCVGKMYVKLNKYSVRWEGWVGSVFRFWWGWGMRLVKGLEEVVVIDGGEF